MNLEPTRITGQPCAGLRSAVSKCEQTLRDTETEG